MVARSAPPIDAVTLVVPAVTPVSVAVCALSPAANITGENAVTTPLFALVSTTVRPPAGAGADNWTAIGVPAPAETMADEGSVTSVSVRNDRASVTGGLVF